MITCIQCQTELAIADAEAARKMRCANCGSIFGTGEEGAKTADRLAWRSLWLGISSVLLACFTGIPAVYYGMRSLLKMRHSPSRQSDRAAATIGVALGTIFSIFGSLLLMVIGAIVSVAFFMTQSSTDAETVMALQEQICTVDLPASLKPEKSLKVMDQVEIVHLRDNADNDKVTVRVAMACFRPPMEFNRDQFKNDIEDLNLHRKWGRKVDTADVEDLTWVFNNRETSVTKNTSSYVDSNVVVTRYTMFLEQVKEKGRPNTDRGIAIVLRQPDNDIDEDAVKKIFESFGPPSSGTEKVAATSQEEETSAAD